MTAISKTALSFGLLLIEAAGGQRLRWSGEWWRNLPAPEQTGFVLGYYDCPVGPTMVYGASSDDYIAYIESSEAKFGTSSSVVGLLAAAHRHMSSHPVLDGGEKYRERHGWLDGEWWGDTTHGNAQEKQGYVEGYLACKSAKPTQASVSHLRSQIDKHFDHPAKVANVLEPLLNRHP